MLTQPQRAKPAVPAAPSALTRSPFHPALPHQDMADTTGVPAPVRWLPLVMDEIDYGVLLVSPRLEVLYSNLAARRELRRDNPVRLEADRLVAQQGNDAATLREAVHSATQRGLRRLIVLGSSRKRIVLTAVPLPNPAEDEPVALMMLGKRSACESLSAQGFASCHGLTPTERDVLAGLCAGHAPRRIAANHGVSLSTVRAQIASIRGKTGASSIRALLEQVAQLPPLVGTLRSC